MGIIERYIKAKAHQALKALRAEKAQYRAAAEQHGIELLNAVKERRAFYNLYTGSGFLCTTEEQHGGMRAVETAANNRRDAEINRLMNIAFPRK